MLNYKNIKSERQWKSVVGVSSLQFYKLCKEFGLSFERIYHINIQELSSNLNTEFLLPTYEDCLFFVLFQLKNGLSYDSLGLLIGTDGGNAHLNFEKYLTVLESSLVSLGKMPKREFSNLAEFETYFKENKDIILDATEHPTQRPKGYKAQKELYSGKKKTHTNKELIISNKKKYIHYISKTYQGKEHDYGILKKEFPPEIAWFKEFNVRLDLGFQGFEELYPCQNIAIPIKKPRNSKTVKNELTDEQKIYNRELAQQRIYVEHSIGGMKRYRILVNRNRLKSKKTINQVIGVCAALWNFTIEP